jgi:hypothetical protein
MCGVALYTGNYGRHPHIRTDTAIVQLLDDRIRHCHRVHQHRKMAGLDGAVVYLELADNASVGACGTIVPFHHREKGCHHGTDPVLLPTLITQFLAMCGGGIGVMRIAQIRCKTLQLLDRRFSWGKIGSHSPPQLPVFFEDIASFCEWIFLPHELDGHALIPV